MKDESLPNILVAQNLELGLAGQIYVLVVLRLTRCPESIVGRIYVAHRILRTQTWDILNPWVERKKGNQAIIHLHDEYNVRLCRCPHAKTVNYTERPFVRRCETSPI